MKKKLKSLYLILSSLFLTVLNLPLAFAKPIFGNRSVPKPVVSVMPLPSPVPMASFDNEIFSSVKSVYDSLHLDLNGLSRQAFVYAKKGWQKLLNQGRLVNDSVMAIVDFSQSSDHKRLYVLDMKNYRVLFNTLVAHGRNSGKELASSFSNRAGSYKSSPGFYITQDTYMGNNGYSLKLEGIEKGINDKAYSRAIVMHGADYVDESWVSKQGFIGRSEGCPAVPVQEAGEIIDALKNGACLFVYTPKSNYTSRSSMLR
ncbi:MAG TPA: murein L,D-transpeptidase catalytic domain family protein [Chitinophagaceae bacterium]|nr:murein L,D-transpeptidase catalytic domain family protein [Chitinophagaceae bacterium]